MLDNIPGYVPIVFGVTTLITIWAFYVASRKSISVLMVLLTWVALQSVVGLSGFYTVTDGFPPRFVVLIGPPMMFIIGLFTFPRGRKFLDQLDTGALTLLHTIRIPIEIVLFWLFTYKVVPEIMTFEGRNLDILSGITAPMVYYLAFKTKSPNHTWLLIWNFLCLGLLFNIVITAILSVPTSFQEFGFEQPNIGILYFPFVWLPCCVVPLVFLSHLATIRKLINRH